MNHYYQLPSHRDDGGELLFMLDHVDVHGSVRSRAACN